LDVNDTQSTKAAAVEVSSLLKGARLDYLVNNAVIVGAFETFQLSIIF
jgi:NAD(P)-dependent dehydrogenase (short-subunit alcohol dehydrogenase family)